MLAPSAPPRRPAAPRRLASWRTSAATTPRSRAPPAPSLLRRASRSRGPSRRTSGFRDAARARRAGTRRPRAPERALRVAALRFDRRAPRLSPRRPAALRGAPRGRRLRKAGGAADLAPRGPPRRVRLRRGRPAFTRSRPSTPRCFRLLQPPSEAFFQARSTSSAAPPGSAPCWRSTGPSTRARGARRRRALLPAGRRRGGRRRGRAWIHRPGKKAQRGAGARLGKKRLLLEHGRKALPEDARIASLPARRQRLRPRGRRSTRSSATRASSSTQVRRPTSPCADRARAGGRHGRGAPRRRAGERRRRGHGAAPRAADRARRARPEEVLFLWDWDKQRAAAHAARRQGRRSGRCSTCSRARATFSRPRSHGALLAAPRGGRCACPGGHARAA